MMISLALRPRSTIDIQGEPIKLKYPGSKFEISWHRHEILRPTEDNEVTVETQHMEQCG